MARPLSEEKRAALLEAASDLIANLGTGASTAKQVSAAGILAVLGITGAIYKRKWELDNQRQHLERALNYYLRGYSQGAEKDQGYTGINAAYILDLFAHQETREARKAGLSANSEEYKRIQARRTEAKRISTPVFHSWRLWWPERLLLK